MSLRLGLVALAVAAAACSKASEESAVKRSPAPPPPPEVEVPRALRIDVVVDGVAGEPLTGERLRGTAPDFHDDERRAWRIGRLIPAFDRPGASLEARGAEGVAIRVTRPDSDAAPQPVLFLTRRGDVIVSVVDPKDPFPRYHGHGGQLRRQGDPLPRIARVVALEVESPDR